MKLKPHGLQFISQIKRDGTGVIPISESIEKGLKEGLAGDSKYKILCLSVTEKTYIAVGFNSYVVKIIPKVHVTTPSNITQTGAAAC